MLMSTANRHADLPSELDAIHNYYELLVFDQIQQLLSERIDDHDYIADIACVALNQLPPRYIRHSVDMAFYLSPNERQEMLDKVSKAVAEAIAFVDHGDVHTTTD